MCVMHHCRHPHDDEGSHTPPDPALQLLLAARSSWDVAFNTNITYQCQPGTWVEKPEPDPSQNTLEVRYRQALLSSLIGWIMMLLTPALLCYKDTALSLWHKGAYNRISLCHKEPAKGKTCT